MSQDSLVQKLENFCTAFHHQTLPLQQQVTQSPQKPHSLSSTGHANSPAPIIIRRKTTQTPKVFRRGQKQPYPVSLRGSVLDDATDLEGLVTLMATPGAPLQGKLMYLDTLYKFTSQSCSLNFFVSNPPLFLYLGNCFDQK